MTSLISINTNETDRLAALRSYHVLDSLEEKEFDELTMLASVICNTPIATISLVDEKRQWFKSRIGVTDTETPIEQSFCAHAINPPSDIMVVADASQDQRFRDNPLVTGDPGIVFYAGVPLINEDGFALGTLCVIDRKKHQLTEEQTSALKILARQVMAKLELRRKVNQLRENQESLRMLADNMSQLAWMTDAEGYIFWYNQRWFDYTGTTLEDMKGWGWSKVHHPDELDRVTKKWSNNISKGEIWEDTFPLLSKAGEYRWFLSRAVPLKNAEGKIVRWFGTNTDVHEQRKDDERKNDFIGMVSHELKTPLTSINANVQMMLHKAIKNEDTTNAAALERVNKQVGKMTKMINGFLNVSRLDSGKIHISKQRFDMAALIHEIEEEIQSTVTSHEVVFAPVDPTFVTADQDKIGQVIQNLVSNAIKYSPQHTVVRVACVPVNGYAQVSVTDQGMGVRPEDVEKIFDRFYRVEGKHMDSIAGFGIGLYLCVEIVQRHYGKIWVESEFGKGSTFRFITPLDKD